MQKSKGLQFSNTHFFLSLITVKTIYFGFKQDRRGNYDMLCFFVSWIIINWLEKNILFMIYNEENEITISHQSSLSTYTVNKVSHESTLCLQPPSIFKHSRCTVRLCLFSFPVLHTLTPSPRCTVKPITNLKVRKQRITFYWHAQVQNLSHQPFFHTSSPNLFLLLLLEVCLDACHYSIKENNQI